MTVCFITICVRALIWGLNCSTKFYESVRARENGAAVNGLLPTLKTKSDLQTCTGCGLKVQCDVICFLWGEKVYILIIFICALVFDLSLLWNILYCRMNYIRGQKRRQDFHKIAYIYMRSVQMCSVFPDLVDPFLAPPKAIWTIN